MVSKVKARQEFPGGKEGTDPIRCRRCSACAPAATNTILEWTDRFSIIAKLIRSHTFAVSVVCHSGIVSEENAVIRATTLHPAEHIIHPSIPHSHNLRRRNAPKCRSTGAHPADRRRWRRCSWEQRRTVSDFWHRVAVLHPLSACDLENVLAEYSPDVRRLHPKRFCPRHHARVKKICRVEHGAGV